MIYFNTFSDCVSSDTLSELFSTRGGYGRLQHTTYTSMLSLYAKPHPSKVSPHHLEALPDPNFWKRGFIQDLNKETLQHLFARKADFLMVSTAPTRLKLLQYGDHLVTNTRPNFTKPEILDQLNIENYDIISPAVFSDEELQKAVWHFCDDISKVYTPRQIIFQKHYNVLEYTGGTGLAAIGNVQKLAALQAENELIDKLDAMFLERIPGCHIIEFPEGVIADKKHRWKFHPLHYTKSYYEYASKALEIITQQLKQADEEIALKELLHEYSHICTLEKENLKLKTQLRHYEHSRALENALTFSKQLNLDIFGSQKVIGYFSELAEEVQSVALLKANDIAGNIISTALEAMQVPVIYTTPKGSLTALTEEEWERCKLADVILSAEVHSKAETEREGRKAFRVASLLEQAEEAANS